VISLPALVNHLAMARTPLRTIKAPARPSNHPASMTILINSPPLFRGSKSNTIGIIKLMYTKTVLQLADINTTPICGRHLQSMVAYFVDIRFYPASDYQHYMSLYLGVCRLMLDYIKYGKPIPISGSA
jgi:hypothetical protein